MTDSLGRKWQTCTIQLDYAAPERFDLTYVGDDNKEHRPVVIHRAIYGSFERFIAILTEHYAGAFPAWLAPVQARVLTVSDRFDAWAQEVHGAARRGGASGSSWTGPRTSSARRSATPSSPRSPSRVVIGEKEVEAKAVAPRRHGGADLKTMPLDAFVELMKKEATPPY